MGGEQFMKTKKERGKQRIKPVGCFTQMSNPGESYLLKMDPKERFLNLA